MGFQRLFPAILLLGLTAQPLTASAGPRVQIQTSMGDMVVELHDTRAPATVENFLGYVKEGFYDGTVFHRVIDGFMIQGGGMTPDLRKKPTGAPVENEADNGLKNDKGTIAMARTSDPHSATAQFFINVTDNDFLNHSGKTPRGWGYAVFGRVVEGMDVVERIEGVATGSRRGMGDVPLEPVIIEGISLVEGTAAGE